MAHKFLTILLLTLLLPAVCRGQKFSVAQFTLLQNDISAYMNPVKDLNDNACALIKIICSHDFAFSTPLGIISRKNEVGEVWLYIPEGSIMITLKHPKWGVIRDYRFPAPLEGRLTYEIKLNTPEPNTIVIPATVRHVVKKETIIIRDTIVAPTYTTTKERVSKGPLSLNIHLTAGISNNLLYGIRLFAGRKHGAYIGMMSDMKKMEATGQEGAYDTGNAKYHSWNITAGAYEHLAGALFIYEGAGYGSHNVYWEKLGGEWWKNISECTTGFTVEAGIGYKFKKTTLTAGFTAIKCKIWIPEVGLSFSL